MDWQIYVGVLEGVVDDNVVDVVGVDKVQVMCFVIRVLVFFLVCCRVVCSVVLFCWCSVLLVVIVRLCCQCVKLMWWMVDFLVWCRNLVLFQLSSWVIDVFVMLGCMLKLVSMVGWVNLFQGQVSWQLLQLQMWLLSSGCSFSGMGLLCLMVRQEMQCCVLIWQGVVMVVVGYMLMQVWYLLQWVLRVLVRGNVRLMKILLRKNIELVLWCRVSVCLLCQFRFEWVVSFIFSIGVELVKMWQLKGLILFCRCLVSFCRCWCSIL